MTPLTAHLSGGTGDGRVVQLPLEQFPPTVDFVTSAGTVVYERVAHTAIYRPAAVLDKLAASSSRTPAKKTAPKPRRAPKAGPKAGPKAAAPEFQAMRS